jgi:hypothetical protein
MYAHQVSVSIRSEITIAAPPERVWAILTDFASYPDWNPFIKTISGDLRVGSRLAVRIAPTGGAGMAFTPVVTEMRGSAVLEWLGRLFIPGIFDGRHRFELVPLADGTTSFTQSETFAGLLVPLFSSTLKATERGFIAANEALKTRSETV